MAVLDAPQTPPVSSVERYVNPTFTTDSLEDENQSSSPRSTPSSSPSPKRYTFTPRRVAKLPRAWERKPATPFAPRTDSQRIWKRVPLGETQGTCRTTKEAERLDQAGLKVLKKLKRDGKEEENAVYLSTKWDEAQDIVRRKISQSTETVVESGQKQRDMSIKMSDDSTIGEETSLGGPKETQGTLPHESYISKEDGDTVSPLKMDGNFLIPEKNYFESSIMEEASDPDESDREADVSDPNMDQTQLPDEDSDTLEEEHQSLVASTIEVKSSKPPETIQGSAPERPIREPLSESANTKSPPRRRRSSLAALFTGEGLVTLPDAAEATATTSSEQSVNPLINIANDDTVFLHEFLTRARAQKAAKASSSPEKPPKVTVSPTKKTRQTIGAVNSNSPSPSKSDNLQLLPDEMTEENSEAKLSSPCRRSNRTRLPRPQKAITAVPSNIPVRRSNGTEFVFLQRTEAQEIALATRANTKRNKGDAMHPKIKLPYINSTATNLSPTKSPKKRKPRKEVTWDERLTHFHEGMPEEGGDVEVTPETTAAPEVQETSSMDKKPKARKMKRLGTVNGTPAPRRTVMADDVGTESQIPARKLRSRVKS